MNIIQRAREVLDTESAALAKVRDGLGPAFEQAVRCLLDRLGRGGKIVVTGVGKNQPIGQKIAATLTSTGAPSLFLHPSDAMHGDLGLLQANDALVVLSYSGASEELLALLPAVKRTGMPAIALTGDPESALSKLCDIVVPVQVDREACPFNMAPTASTTATLAVGDALAMVLLEARGFQLEDYAKLHPGGAIGRTLLMRVEDIMRTGERVAKVRPDTRVQDAVLAMTAARSGSAVVVDDRDAVVGICTDGDLRRHIVDNSRNVASLNMADVMTREPIRLTRGHLAVDVLAIFEQHNIDDLIIVDEGGRLMGMIDIQDLPKFKIF
ncbi:MAG TPA: KpsF/GutQ family sugar-phosphate isomerase [Kiritimatiellia bacterium]|nr:KpsF/GutQ family sugar-phosphate isomerase [Kiritimatiellia bacterium]HRZ11155.1 KpsF/GutQ family sugar-phosphate isomerase [Kiritimatiellia bacterium]HSA19473.1 KpsF/GutQ family sugar-phosphate isomerase [Kiritimatiellia bacterium]